MPTNLPLDAKLIEEAVGWESTRPRKKRLPQPWPEYIKRRKQLRILDAFGTFDFDPAYDYKADRRRR
jgi:hypothetical protein